MVLAFAGCGVFLFALDERNRRFVAHPLHPGPRCVSRDRNQSNKVGRDVAGEQSSGLEEVFLANRERLLRFLKARGAGDASEDLLQDVWLKIAARDSGPIASPLSYLFRMADLLMIDRYRASSQARRRENDWIDLHGGAVPGVSDAPSAERHLIGQDYARLVEQVLAGLAPPRVAIVFRMHRIDGVPQRQIASDLGVSLSTVESDLRKAYQALAELKERLDEA